MRKIVLKENGLFSKKEENMEIQPLEEKQLLSSVNIGAGLPDYLGNLTLNELIKMANVEVKKKDNYLKVKQISATETITLEVRIYPDGIAMLGTAMTKPTKKKKLRATVLRMLEEGKSQEEVAHILDMSQSYVSKISKSDD
jgi:hypothetical protein